MDSSTENEVAQQPLDQTKNNGRTKKIVIGIILLGLIAFVIADSLTNKNVKKGIDIFLQWIQDNPIPGVFAFMGVYFIATVLFIPGSILTLGSGFIFANVFGLGVGVLLASIAVFIGASAGAVVAFILARYLLRDWAENLTKKYPLFEAVDAALADKGFRIMALLRLSPIIPFNALNYIAGITAISLAAYTWAMIAILPGTILYVFLGATAGSLADSSQSSDNNTVKIVSIVVGIVFGILAIAAVSYYAKKELNKAIERQREEASAYVLQNSAEEGNNSETARKDETTIDVESGNNGACE